MTLLLSFSTTALLLAVTIIMGNLFVTTVAQSQSTNHGRQTQTQLITYDYTECPQVPTLHCKNGSTCTPGIASFGEQHDHLDLQSHENGFYCKCPPGFIGHECGVQVDECDGVQQAGPSSCYHGSACKTNSNGAYCDCIELNSNSDPSDTKYEGDTCQHESTSLCAVSLVGERAPNHQFCTNHGQCVKMVTSGEPHPGCMCSNGWMGDHCEIMADPFTLAKLQNKDQGGGSSGGKVLFSLIIIVLVAVLISIGFIVMKKKRATTGNNADGPAVFRGEIINQTGSPKKKLGEGDLDADGSGTLGSERKYDGDNLLKIANDIDKDGDNPDGYEPETEVV